MEKLVAAIKRAIISVAGNNESIGTEKESLGLHTSSTAQSTSSFSGPDLGQQFCDLVLARFNSVEHAWSLFDIKNRGWLSRSDFKRVVDKSLGMACSDVERKGLRAKLDPQNSKRVSFDAFAEFVGRQHEGGTRQNEKDGKQQEEKSIAVAVLPMDVPALPDSFRPRANVEMQLKAKLLDRESKPCVTAIGM